VQHLLIEVLGLRGSGKTTLIKGEEPHTAGLISFAPKPVYIIDLLDNYSAGWVFTSAEKFRRYKIAEHEGKAQSNKYYTLKKVREDQENDYLKIINIAKLSGTIVIDEAHQLCGRHKKNEHVNSIVQVGRNYNQTLILAARRAAQIHVDWRSQIDIAISYRQQHSKDIRALSFVDEDAKQLKNLSKDSHNYKILGYHGNVNWLSEFISDEKKRGNYGNS